MNILYVEDNFLNARVLSAIIDANWHVSMDVAVSAEDAIPMINGKKYDLIFMDINLPGISGIELTKLIKNDPAQANIPIIAISADATPGTKNDAQAAGCMAYVTKPIIMERFIATTHQFLSSHKKEKNVG